MTHTPHRFQAGRAVAAIAVAATSLIGISSVPGVSSAAGRSNSPAPVPIRRLGAANFRAAAEANQGPGRILVGTTDGRVAPLLGGAVRHLQLRRAGIDVLDVADVAAGLATYRAAPGVAWVEADRSVVAAAAPDDPLFPAQWSLQTPAEGSPTSLDWSPVYPTVQGEGALVAVLDTGYQIGGNDQATHIRTDLARNFVTNSTDVSDDNGHGTFVSNIIAEATGNHSGTAGIAPKASIVPIKVLGSDGSGDLSIVAQGIDYAASIGAKVINLSIAGDQSPALCASVAAAARVSVVVAATGNDATATSTHGIDFPAACPGALSVGSIAYDGSRPSYANTGCPIDLVAPGGDDLNQFDPTSPHSDWVLQQTYDANPADSIHFGTFQFFQEEGTSMSAAQVSGEAALLVGLGADVATARRLIVVTARSPARGVVTPTYGAGTADIAAAVGSYRPGVTVTLPQRGYRVVTSTGGVRSLSDPCENGDQGHVTQRLARPIVGATGTPSGLGYWLVASDGGIFTFGDAAYRGSTGALALNKPIVGMAATPDGKGYWLVASDGGIFSFGDAAFQGSTGALTLNRPIVGMAATPDGKGYWLVASDGGIFSFGDAAFQGSTGALTLNRPIVGMAATPDGKGYWLVASDGGIFSFGGAGYFGSTGALPLVSPITAMTPTADGRGYLLVAVDGGVFTFGDAVFHGSATGGPAPVVSLVPEPWPGL